MANINMPNLEEREPNEVEQNAARLLARAKKESGDGDHETAWEWLRVAEGVVAGAEDDIGDQVRESLSETRERVIARMRPEADFAVAGGESEVKAKTSGFLKKCENFELRIHAADFDADERDLVEKYIMGGGLENEESNKINKLRRDWWKTEKSVRPACSDAEAKKNYLEQVYGSVSQGCRNRVKINNILKDQKHVSLEEMKKEEVKKKEMQKAGMVYSDNLWALKNSKAVELKNQLEADYPGQVEGIETLFGLGNFFDNEKALDQELESNDGWTDFGLAKVQEKTEYRFLLTDLIIKNTHNEEFAQNFWQTMEEVSRQAGKGESFESLKNSTLSQVAVFRALEILGFAPKLSHPREDAFGASDLRLGPKEVVQVVGLGEEQGMLADYITFPGVEAKKDGKVTYVSDFITAKTQKFVRRASSYDKNIEKGLMVGIPIDQIKETGEPDEEFIVFLAEKLGVKYEKK